MSTVFLDGLQ